MGEGGGKGVFLEVFDDFVNFFPKNQVLTKYIVRDCLRKSLGRLSQLFKFNECIHLFFQQNVLKLGKITKFRDQDLKIDQCSIRPSVHLSVHLFVRRVGHLIFLIFETTIDFYASCIMKKSNFLKKQNFWQKMAKQV